MDLRFKCSMITFPLPFCIQSIYITILLHRTTQIQVLVRSRRFLTLLPLEVKSFIVKLNKGVLEYATI